MEIQRIQKAVINMYDYDVIVIGGGQAGLAMGRILQQENRRFVIMEKHSRVGDSWRNRYDTLVLFTPRRYSDLPDFPFPGERDGLPTKDDTANYLDQYAAHFQLPVMLQTEVVRVEKTDGGFRVHTSQTSYLTQFVVIAAGPFQEPFVPYAQKKVHDEVVSLHTAHYKNENQLKEGPVLVVGAGNSGAQIAAELAEFRPVIWSSGQKRYYLPDTFLGKPIFSYLGQFGLLHAPRSSWIGRKMSVMPDPIFGYRQQIRRLMHSGHLRLAGRTVDVSGRTITFEDGRQETVANIIWATGYRFQLDWLHIPEVMDDRGRPVHQRGVSPAPGLYFLGLPWQHNRSSALIGGVGADAHFLATHMKSMLASLHSEKE